MTVNVAVIGAGVMGADHAKIISGDIPGASLHVLCDADSRRARAVADATGATHVVTDPTEAVTRKDVDAVLVASPDATHVPLTLAALAAGKPVLCEKPLGTDSRSCLEVIAAETALGRRLVQTGFMRRFDPAYTEMKTALDAGRIGRALMLHCFHRNVEVPAWFTGAMAITNSAPHEFDIARFLLAADIAAATAFAPAEINSGTVGPVFLVLETASGVLVNVEVNNNARYGYDVRGELVGETGSVFLKSPLYSQLNTGLRAEEAYPADWRPRFAEAYRLQNKDWIRSVAEDRHSATAASAWDGYAASAVAEAGVRALANGGKVAVEMESPPLLYA